MRMSLPELINCICVLAGIFIEHIVILLQNPVVLWQRSFLWFFGRKLLFASNQRREASSSAMASGQASQDLSNIHIHFPNPALDPAVESKSLMIQGPGKRPHLGARMIAIFTIGGTCSVTGRDLARSEPRQTDSSAFVRTKRTHVDRPPGIAVSDARCRNYPRTVASEELGLTVSTVNLRVSLPQAISRSAQAETRSAPS
jgi:hypothetical protein